MATSGILSAKPWRDIYFSGYDGIRLYGRHYPGNPEKRPLLCLANITENGRAFEPLARALSNHETGSRSVYTLDFRGRGLSENDPDWQNYNPMIEMLDVLNFLAMERLHRPTILAAGWSGVITMTLATLYTSMIGPVILNDTGPKLETNGLIRLQAFIGRIPAPTSWRKAAELLRELYKNQFTDLAHEDWLRLAHQQYNEVEGRPNIAYDPNLEKALIMVDPTVGAPEMWDQFMALKHVPVLAIRGENSDVLSRKTLETMFDLHPNLQMFTVANEGHPPRLDDDLSIERIRLFLEKGDHEIPMQVEEDSAVY